ncbi:MAG: NifB/NifX family molybdenum-iron cluster-binding protein [Thermodesulfobacteriota bacterium]|nr:NifB/NifX family molybdenum-iron cluster-binding protein [Thermodesulfobacteriota bacterium]
MGDTKFFYIYDMFEDAKHTFIEKRKNVVKDMYHAAPDKMKKILGIVADCDVLVATKKSPNFVNIANKTRHQPVVVKTTDMADAFVQLHEAFHTIYEYVAREKPGRVST